MTVNVEQMASALAECNKCPLTHTQRILEVSVNKQASFAAVIEAPTYNEMDASSPWSSAGGSLIRKLIQEAGYDAGQWHFDYAIQCNYNTPQEQVQAVRHCKTRLVNRLSEIPNLKVILTFGANAVKGLLGNAALGKILNHPQKIQLNDKDVVVVPTYHPAYTNRNPEAIQTLREAVQLVSRITQGSVLTQRMPTIIQINDDILLKEALYDIQTATCVGFDVETGGDLPEDGLKLYSPKCKLLTAAFAVDDKAYWIDINHTAEGQPEWARKLIECAGHKLVMHNAKFDTTAVRTKLNYQIQNWDDTLLASYILDENTDHSLKALAGNILGWFNYDAGMKAARGRLQEMDVTEVGNYNALDASSTLHIWKLLKGQLSDVEKVLYTFLKRATIMYSEMSFNGIPVDIGYIGKVKVDLEEEYSNLTKSLNNDEAVKKTLERLGEETFSITKAAHIIALMETLDCTPNERTETGQVSTAAKTLKTLEGYPVFAQILRMKEITKMLTTYVTGFMKWVYEDGKVHPSFSLTGTATGRTSCSSPNVQQIPRNEVFKNYFYAPDGYKILHWDFKSAEVYVAASFSGDEDLLGAIRSGEDMHRSVASMVFNKPPEEISSDERTYAKRTTFGIFYGISPKGLSEQINASEAIAKDIMMKYLGRFPRLASWLKDQQKRAMQQGYITTPFGRKRRLPQVWGTDRNAIGEAMRQAVNMPIQATASDLNILLLLHMHEHINKEKAWLINSIHDAGELMVHESYIGVALSHLADGLNSINSRMPFLKIPLAVDVEIGSRGGELTKIKLTE